MEKEEELYLECRKLTNEELLRQLDELSAAERIDLVRILVRLHELDRRELALEIGYPSVFVFCVRRLRYSEATAFRRTKAAKVCHRFPFVLRALEAGEIELTAAAMLEPLLTRDNCHRLVQEAKGKSTREVERLVASLGEAKAPAAERVRFVAVRREAPAAQAVAVPKEDALQAGLPLESPGTPSQPPPIDVEVCSVRSVTCPEAVERMIQRAKELLWHKYPQGRFEDILREALGALLERLEPAVSPAAGRGRRGRSERGGGRYIRKWVREALDRRDGDRCAFMGPDGTRCTERAGLEYDHVRPFSLGGRSDDPANLIKTCRGHNQWRARKTFGSRVPSRRQQDLSA
jgi:hypothetical protein